MMTKPPLIDGVLIEIYMLARLDEKGDPFSIVSGVFSDWQLAEDAKANYPFKTVILRTDVVAVKDDTR